MVGCPNPFMRVPTCIEGLGSQTSEIKRFDVISFHGCYLSFWNLSLISDLLSEIPVYHN